LDQGETILAAGDHVVVTKAGKKTYGLDRFFSSLYGKAVPGLCCLSLSLIRVKRRTSSPALIDQVEKAPVAQTPPKKTATGSRGRPKGSKKSQPPGGSIQSVATFHPRASGSVTPADWRSSQGGVLPF